MEVKAHLMRGGTSKCWVFDARDIRASGISADVLLPRLYGSPDSRQVDGVGGATSTTSKAVIVEPAEREGIDVDYTFAQVGIDEAKVDWGSNCGNCSATVGLHAVIAGWVTPTGDQTRVVVLNTNTDQVIVETVDTPGGRLSANPTAQQTGVSFPGHRVALGFRDPAGKSTGSLLPTGRPVDWITTAGTEVAVTLIDAGAPCAFVAAADLGLGEVPHDQWTAALEPQLELLDGIRRQAAVLMGLAETPGLAERAVPKVGVVAPGGTDGVDVDVVMLSMGAPHPAMPITGSVALTSAVAVPGSTAWTEGGADGTDHVLRTPAGLIETTVERAPEGTVVSVSRTARLLASAVLPIPGDVLPHADQTIPPADDTQEVLAS